MIEKVDFGDPFGSVNEHNECTGKCHSSCQCGWFINQTNNWYDTYWKDQQKEYDWWMNLP